MAFKLLDVIMIPKLPSWSTIAMVRTQIQLNEAQIRTLKRLASDRSVSMAELIRQSVDLFLLSAGYTDDGSLRMRALAASGRFHSGRSDIATAHDEYLPEAFGS